MDATQRNEMIGKVVVQLLNRDDIDLTASPISIEGWDRNGLAVTVHGVRKGTGDDQEYRVFVTDEGYMGGMLERHWDGTGMTRWAVV